jgi:hypothetical protein
MPQALVGRTVQGLLRDKDVKTTMIYTHVLNRGPGSVRSPADKLVLRDEVATESAALAARYSAVPRRITLPKDI